MTDHPMDPRDVLISLVTAALTAAETDAAAPDSGLIFRPEWRPAPRTRGSTSQPQGTPGENKSSSWLSLIINQLSVSGLQLQQHQPFGPPVKPIPSSASEHPLLSTSASPPTAASAPESPLPLGRPPPPQPLLQEDAVAELLKKNQDVFDEVINHPFPRAFGKGTASLDGFRYYMIQDKLYLETCARLKMNAVAASPNFEDIETFEFRHKSSIEYVKKLKEICVTMLGIPESTIKTIQRSVELDASERFYKDALRNEDALLGYYVVLLPCVLTYWRIAERLMNDPLTVKNVIYHSAWTVVNHDPSSVGKYTKFINENIAAKGGIDRWNYIFRIACQLEAKLFNTGLQASTPFQIIPDGTYSIHISSAKSVVLAIQNVKGFLRPPLDKLLNGYFPSDAGSSVLGMNKTGGDNERWHVVATKAGYTFQNLGTGLYLGICTESDRAEGRILQAVFEPYYWWINPVSRQPDQESPVYQIYDSVNLRYTLHADIEVLNSIGSTNFCYTPIIAHDNSEVSCQMWSFNDKFEQLEHAQVCPDDHKWAEYRNAELGRQLQKAQATNAAFEAERAIYMRENSLLQQELEDVRLANPVVQAEEEPLNGQSVALPPLADKSEVTFIAVMGMSKSGKSTLINLATRSGNIRVGFSANSCTGIVEAAAPFELDGRQVVLIDTPAFDHTHKSEAEILRNIALELETKYRQGIKLHGIIYLYRISDVRVSNTAKRDFLGLRKLCGDRGIRNIVILTSMWKRVNAEHGKRRAADLQFLDDFFRPALEDGARFMHHTDGTVDFVHTIIRLIIRNQPEALAIQEELVDKDMDIDQTSVGKEVNRWIEERIEGYEAQDDELWDSAEQARRDGDEETRSDLLEELRNVRAKIAKLEKERLGQALDYKRHRQLNQSRAGVP